MSIQLYNGVKQKKSSFFSTQTIVTIIIFTFVLGPFNNAWAKELQSTPQKWVGTWATAPQLVEPNNMPPAPGLTGNTLRQIVRVSVGGKKLRIKFSNEYSLAPVTLKAVTIAVSAGGSAVKESTNKALTFNGKQEVTMEPGSVMYSDGLVYDLKAGADMAITILFGSTSPTITGHPGSRTTSYLITGNNIAHSDFSQAVKTDHWYIINGIEVDQSKHKAAVAIIGDSITDGRGSGTNKQNRWPDVLAQKLLEEKKEIGVLNLGIGGNCVLRGGLGPTGLSRFNRDILQQNGVRWLIVLEGVNDIGGVRDSTAAAQVAEALIAAYSKIISQAHSRGIKVFGATITPIKKSFYYTDYREKARNTVNEWIRTSGRFDATIDFDRVLSDPNNSSTIIPEAQSGDYLHPNEVGYEMMGKSVKLSLFR
ncbi:SGNH/GDSL hydrolase family protein [Mucilaginibacter sp. PAMB04168]|uniref:SGNH/GDSL hydrolase family protein n=1 Tax=Mucilaginibacter sp. PAMB04168 TaxID=3138567 RepID=UPI0031F63A58